MLVQVFIGAPANNPALQRRQRCLSADALSVLMLAEIRLRARRLVEKRPEGPSIEGTEPSLIERRWGKTSLEAHA